MSELCSNAVTRERHEIVDGGRRLEIRFAVSWGDDDERADHEKTLAFCSFGCLAAWAADRAAVHDGDTLTAA